MQSLTACLIMFSLVPRLFPPPVFNRLGAVLAVIVVHLLPSLSHPSQGFIQDFELGGGETGW